uniref:Regulator of microtubule dynamics protein 3 n=1 Tax=Sinocyclocheilus grahami TaxID=75366 RepID=A0A672RJ43_SINGR
MSWLGRNAVIGLGVGVTISTGLIALLIIQEALRRRTRRLQHNTSSGLQSETVDSAALTSAVRDLSPEQHVELRKTLDEVMKSVSCLRREIVELREGLRDISTTIAEDVKKTVEESQRSRRRRPLMPRERSESMSSSSIYFTASAGVASLCDDSEVGYSTAYSNAESDYTDRETDQDGEDDGRDSDGEEEESCVTVLTLRQDDSQAEEEDDEDAGLMVESLRDIRSPELALLLTQCDLLHAGDSGKKAEGFQLLMENRPLYADNMEFMWRLARAYSDMCETADNREEKRNYAEQGHYEAEVALTRNGLSADCHKWFAILAHLSSQYESIHGKLKSGRVLKEHLDRALALRDDDPICFYLLGRWCLEKTKITTLFHIFIPTASLVDARSQQYHDTSVWRRSFVTLQLNH